MRIFGPALLLLLLLPLVPPACADGVIAGGGASTAVPLTVSPEGHLLVSARLDGRGPFVFLLDTGAERNVLDAGVARALGLRTRGRMHVRGIGPHRAEATQTDAVTVGIGAASLPGQKFVALDLGGLKRVLGQTPVGLLGANVFKEFVVRVDPARKTLGLSLPGAFTYAGAGAALPLSFNKAGCPRIGATLDGIAATFDLDTGAGGGLLLFADFVARNRLRERFASRLQAATTGGVGGDIPTQITPPLQLDFGGLRALVPAVLATERAGNTGARDAAGLIGEGVLGGLVVTFDYRRRRVYLEAPDGPPAPNSGATAPGGGVGEGRFPAPSPPVPPLLGARGPSGGRSPA